MARPSLERPLGLLRRAVDWNRLRLLGRVGPGERVLEIGAGRGRLVSRLSEGGADVLGIEPATSASEAARDSGANVENVSLEQVSVPPGSCDLVILWHVLEHLDNPAAAMARVRPWISEGGRVVVAVPNLASVQARLGGDRWFHQDVPRHRTQFTVEGLIRLLRRTGFAATKTRLMMVEQSFRGMWLTLLNRLTSARDVPFRFIKRDLKYGRRRDALRDGAISLLVGPVLIPVAVAIELVAQIRGSGGCVVIEAVVDRNTDRQETERRPR